MSRTTSPTDHLNDEKSPPNELKTTIIHLAPLRPDSPILSIAADQDMMLSPKQILEKIESIRKTLNREQPCLLIRYPLTSATLLTLVLLLAFVPLAVMSIPEQNSKHDDWDHIVSTADWQQCETQNYVSPEPGSCHNEGYFNVSTLCESLCEKIISLSLSKKSFIGQIGTFISMGVSALAYCMACSVRCTPTHLSTELRTQLNQMRKEFKEYKIPFPKKTTETSHIPEVQRALSALELKVTGAPVPKNPGLIGQLLQWFSPMNTRAPSTQSSRHAIEFTS